MVTDKTKGIVAGSISMLIVAGLIMLGSRNLAHFDAALIGYTFAVIFASFSIAYRYTVWLQRPPTRLYWKRGWQLFFHSKYLTRNIIDWLQYLTKDFVFNKFIFKRGKSRWTAHWFIMWGTLTAIAITFPLVFGWVHFETLPNNPEWYRTYMFGFPGFAFPIHSIIGFLIFHGLVWSSIAVIIGVALAMRRRIFNYGAVSVQLAGEDFLPLILLFAISLTGLMLTVSYSWLKGSGYEFLAIFHAIIVIFTLLWLPFGKLFHIFQRPAQLGVAFYKEIGQKEALAHCRRCDQPFASRMHVEDLIQVEKELGFNYEVKNDKIGHYQWICPPCRRAGLALAQGQLWQQSKQSEVKK